MKLKSKYVRKEENKPQKEFFSSGSYGCAYNPSFTCDGKFRKSKKSKETMTKLTENDFFSQNEFEIGEKLKKTNNKRLIGVTKKCKIIRKKLKQVEKKGDCEFLEDKNYSKHEKDMVLLYSPYVQSVDAYSFLKNTPSLLNIFDFLYEIGKGIQELQKLKIIHHDLHLRNMLSSSSSDFHIIDFGLSILEEKLKVNGKYDKKYLKKIFIKFDPTYTNYPLEHHIMNYALFEGEVPDKTQIEYIVKIYLKNCGSFKKKSETFLLKYHKKSVEFFTKMLSSCETWEDVVNQFLPDCMYTWDIYNISLALSSIINKKYLEEGKSSNNYDELYKLELFLINCTHYDYSMRPTIDEFLRTIQEMKSYYSGDDTVQDDFNHIDVDYKLLNLYSKSLRTI